MKRKELLFFLILLFIGSCEDSTNSSLGPSGYSSFSPDVQRRLRRMDVTGAINTVMDGPARCGSELVQGASSGMNWDQFVANSQKSGMTYNGPYGRVEFYNGSVQSLPGGSGISDVGRSRHLDQSILDIIPFLAMAHKQEGLPMRVSHTTGGVHSSNSLHYSGRAIDIDPHPASRRLDVAEKMRDILRSSGRGCGYFILVEATHIHVSYKGSGYGGCPGFAMEI